MRSRSSGSGRSKVGGPPPGSVSLGSGSGFVIAEDGDIVTNFYVVERAYNMTLGLEERNAYIVEFISNVTNCITGKSHPLSSKSWSKPQSSWSNFSSKSLLSSASEMLINRTRSAFLPLPMKA